MTQYESTLQRINGRKSAEALLELGMPCEGDTLEFKKGFARQLRAYADSVLGTPPTELRVMSDAEAKEFETQLIRFGVHANNQFKDVPIDYLAWVADQASQLSAYIRSSIGRKRIENG